MAEQNYSGLFQTPEALMQAREAALQQQAQAYAKQSPLEAAKALEYTSGARIGQGVRGLLGVQDKELQQVTRAQEVLKDVDRNNPEDLMKAVKILSSEGNHALAEQLFNRARALEKQLADVSAAKATAAKTSFSLEQEQKLRQELSALGPNATEEDFLAVVRKYGKPDEVMKSIETRLQKDQALQQKKADAEAALQARIEIAKANNASKEEIARIMVEGRKDIASLAAALKEDKVATLSVGLQKSEDADLEKINSYDAQAEALKPAISSVSKDPKTGKAPLELGPINNRLYEASNLSGKSTPASKAYAALQRAVQSATNLKVSAEKGVQTDKDVLRFANELTAAFGANDTEVTLEALANFNKAVLKAKSKTQDILQSRRKSQRVEPYQFEETPKPQETSPKPTKRYNPVTKQIESL